jgi:hypothetical protein
MKLSLDLPIVPSFMSFCRHSVLDLAVSPRAYLDLISIPMRTKSQPPLLPPCKDKPSALHPTRGYDMSRYSRIVCWNGALSTRSTST